MFNIIVAADQNRGIGKGGTIPWRLRRDLQFFRVMTLSADCIEAENEFGIARISAAAATAGRFTYSSDRNENRNAVIMGRKTWESIPEKYRPLPGRYNFILSRSLQPGAGETHAIIRSLEEIKPGSGQLFVIGGEAVYSAALRRPDCRRVYYTEIGKSFVCDRFFPELPPAFSETGRSDLQEEDGIVFRFRVFEKT